MFKTHENMVKSKDCGHFPYRVQKANFFFFFCLLRAALGAYGNSQARGLIEAVAASLRQSLGNTRSELSL